MTGGESPPMLSKVISASLQVTLHKRKEKVQTMIHKIEAIVLFVQDLDRCTAFYRDTFKLQYQGSDAASSSFLLQEGLYLILLSPAGTADLLGMPYNAK